jgi:hypothetical protein
MPKNTTQLRAVGKQRLAAVSRQFPKNILVRFSSYCKGWTDPATGREYSAFGSFAHCGTRASFHRITSFAYVGKRLGAMTEALPTTYIMDVSTCSRRWATRFITRRMLWTWLPRTVIWE